MGTSSGIPQCVIGFLLTSAIAHFNLAPMSVTLLNGCRNAHGHCSGSPAIGLVNLWCFLVGSLHACLHWTAVRVISVAMGWLGGLGPELTPIQTPGADPPPQGHVFF